MQVKEELVEVLVYILIIFTSTKKRNGIYNKRRLLKGTEIYINEHLTEKERNERQSLHEQAQQARKQGGQTITKNEKAVRLRAATSSSEDSPAQITQRNKHRKILEEIAFSPNSNPVFQEAQTQNLKKV